MDEVSVRPWTYIGSVNFGLVVAVNRANGEPCINHHPEDEEETDGV